MIDANEYSLKRHEADMVEAYSESDEKEKEIEENYKILSESVEDFYSSAREAMYNESSSHQALHKFFIDKNFEELGKLFVDIVEKELRAEAWRMAN